MKKLILLSMLLSNLAFAQFPVLVGVKLDSVLDRGNPLIITGNKVSGGQFTLSAADAFFLDKRATKKGLEYAADYSANYTSRSLTDVAYVQSQISSTLPSGVIIQYGGTTAPTGYLMCNGSAVSRSTYAALFAIISTTYGSGDGSTTFNLPDIRQRFPLGVAASGTGSTLGSTGGTIDHLHTVNPPSTTSGTPSGVSGQLVGVINVASATHTHDVDIAQFNSGTENPPYIALNYIIKQ